MTTTMTEPTTRTLDVPGAVLTYDVRANDASTDPVLVLIGSPMGAGGFVTLAGHFPDRTIVTYDPRGVERSTKADPASQSTPEQHADDLHRIIAELGVGPVDLFASSGGAVNALALVAKHPEQVRTLVAHEPPLASILPDREGALAATQAIHDTYQRSGFGAGDGAVHRRRQPQGADDGRVRQPARARPGDVRDARRGRRHPDRPAARPEHHRPARTTSPTSTRCGRRRPGSCWPPARSPTARWRTAAAKPSPSASAKRPWSSRATTAASSAASTANPAIPMRSPRSCARSSPGPDVS